MDWNHIYLEGEKDKSTTLMSCCLPHVQCGDLLPPIQILLQAAWLNRKVFLLRVLTSYRSINVTTCSAALRVLTDRDI
jgi:hypothetical protein